MNTYDRLLVAFLFAISVEQDHFTDGAETRNLDFLPPISNKVLKGHDIRTIYAVNEGNCMAECYLEERCVSYNLGPFVDGFHKCELKDADDLHHDGLMPENGYLFRAAKNPCNENTCLGSKTCLTGFTDKGYICQCKPGYRGEPCEDVDECKENKHHCSTDATCENTQGSFNCTCNHGYQGDGVNCNDIDECTKNTHNCSANATCQNTQGSFNCECNNGFTGDGVSCNDIDECSSNPCQNEGTCTDLVNGYTCSCVSGWTGQRCNTNIDECASNPCQNGGACTDKVNGYTCSCANGWAGVNCTTDVDECTENKHNCSADATCENTQGSFNCECNHGYQGDGVNCNDIDECTENTHNCSVDATCQNTQGLFNCECNNGYQGDGVSCIGNATDCSDLYKAGITTSGVYSVDPDGKGTFSVYCDMTTDGGGWTVFQRRQNGSQDFYLEWSQYKAGFGQLTGEFWLGNDKIHRLTASRPSELRVELGDWSGDRAYAKYGTFAVGNEQPLYSLSVGSYSGTAGDALTNHNNMKFTTQDKDNDKWSSGNCAVKHTGAWWYNYCHHSNLNGKYLGNKEDYEGVNWYQYKDNYLSMKFAEMKLRPTN